MIRPLIATVGILTIVVGLLADTPPTVQQLIADLGSPKSAVRETASRELWKRGLTAKPQLQTALASDDPEVVRRAQAILDKFNWYILPTTPEPIAKAIREFRSTAPDRQIAAIDELMKLGEPGLDALQACLGHDFGEPRQAALHDHVLQQSRRLVPSLLVQRRPAIAERILELGLLSKNPEAWLDYANYHVQSGRATDALAKLEEFRKQDPAGRRSAALAGTMLQHLNGDSAGAIRTAEKIIINADDRELLNSLLADAGRWSDLVEADGTEEAPRSFGLDLFHLRKSGQPEKAEALVKASVARSDRGTPSEIGLALLLNSRPLEGIAYLQEKQVQPHLVADLLAARLKFEDAFRGLKDGKSNDEDGLSSQYAIYLSIRQARLRAQLGQREQALTEFRAIANAIRNSNAYQMRELLRAEIRAGQIELAIAHTGRFVAEFERTQRSFYINPDPFEVLFDEDSEAARGWWTAFRTADQTKRESPEDLMRRVHQIVTGHATAERIAEARSVMAYHEERFAKKPKEITLSRIRCQRALAQLARHADDAVAYERHLRAAMALTVAGTIDDADGQTTGPREWVYGVDESVKLWLELGEWLTEQRQFAAAFEVYESAWKKFGDNPIPLYYSGRVLQQMGDQAEGQRRIDLAHVAALGNAQMRGRFLDEMCNHGLLADAKKARDSALKSVWYWNRMRGNVWNQIARASAVVKDFEMAATATERNLHFLLKTPNIVFVEGSGYISVPTSVRMNRVRAALANGQVAGQADEVKAILDLMPGQVEFVTQVVPEFERLGANADADAIFQSMWTTFTKLQTEHPQSSWAAASAAMLAAGCRRELDQGLIAAKRAVELEPEWRPAKEILAEMHFRLGDRAAAIDVMKTLCRHDWRSSFYKRQLVRFERGDLKSPLPVGPEED